MKEKMGRDKKKKNVRYGLSESPEHCLRLTLGAKVAGEALAEASVVVAEAPAGAVAPCGVAFTCEDVGSRGAFLLGAIRAAVAKITDATHFFHGVPGRVVRSAGFGGEMFLSIADATTIAVVGAFRAFTRDATVSVKAVAFTALPVADAHPRAFRHLVDVVFSRHRVLDPCVRLGAGPLRTIRPLPCIFAVRPQITRAPIVSPTGPMARASIRTIRRGPQGHQDEDELSKRHRWLLENRAQGAKLSGCDGLSVA